MSYKITDCNSCGQCGDFVLNNECPTGAFNLEGNKYKTAVIDPDLCIDCGLCKNTIDCLNEAIHE